MSFLILYLGFCAFANADVIADPNGSSGNQPVSEFDSEINRCGVSVMMAHIRETIVGHTMCGEIVKESVQCLAKASGIEGCNAQCGDGRQWIRCAGADLDKCGYVSVGGDSPACLNPGSIRTYFASTTERGKLFGHVEFVCGVNKFCSAYQGIHNQPWPEDRKPSNCWALKRTIGRTLGAGDSFDPAGAYPQSGTGAQPIIHYVDPNHQQQGGVGIGELIGPALQTAIGAAGNNSGKTKKNNDEKVKLDNSGAILRKNFRPGPNDVQQRKQFVAPIPTYNSGASPQSVQPKSNGLKPQGKK